MQFFTLLNLRKRQRHQTKLNLTIEIQVSSANKLVFMEKRGLLSPVKVILAVDLALFVEALFVQLFPAYLTPDTGGMPVLV